MTARAIDPVLSYQFGVEVTALPGLPIPFLIPIKGYFSEVSGIGVEYETMEFKTVDFLGFPRINAVPGRPIYSPITLRRGITGDEGFWLWHQLLVFGLKPLLSASVAVTMYDRSYQPMVQWNIERAWPSKISGPDIRSDSSDIGIEELTLVHSGVSRSYMAPELAVLDGLIQAFVP